MLKKVCSCSDMNFKNKINTVASPGRRDQTILELENQLANQGSSRDLVELSSRAFRSQKGHVERNM